MTGDIIVYTDGGCSGNPGPGGWAYVVLYGGNKVAMSGGDKFTTNNKMELSAVINALKFVSINCPKAHVAVYTDSEYVKKGITAWIKKWIVNGWKTADKKEVKNKELWQELYSLDSRINPGWNWVKGHAGNTYNELCDTMVKKEMEKLS